MTHGVLLVEERSAARLAVEIATKCGIADRITIIPHEGKSDLERSFPRKIIAWQSPIAPRFVVCRDNDGAVCLALKNRLINMIPAGAAGSVRVRLVMQHLESWYLGDIQALTDAGIVRVEHAGRLRHKAKFRDPDRLNNASQEFERLSGRRDKIGLATEIGPHLDLSANRSHSLKVFVSALHWACEDR
jgi:hypothetical protein